MSAPSSISQLCQMIISVSQTATSFKPQLEQLRSILCHIQRMDNIWAQNLEPSVRSELSSELIDTILIAGKLVRKCSDIKWNVFKNVSYLRKLNNVNDKLWESYLHAEVQAEAQARAQILAEARAQAPADRSSMVASKNAPPTSFSCSMEIGRFDPSKWGWRVPMLPKDILTFDQQLNKLKDKVLANYDDCSVVVVSAGGGCGKTTLVNILCYDPKIVEYFGENIFFVTVSETPNFMEIVNDLLNPDLSSHKPMVQSNEDARDKLHSFLCDRISSGPILLVLDDVWSDSFIKNFEFMIIGYKVLVTSCMNFSNYDVLQLETLSDEDAKRLFELSAFKRRTMMPGPTIDEDLVNQMVKCCLKHPLTLAVIGSSLKGKYEFVWKSLLKTLSQDEWVLGDKDVLKRLQRTIEELDEDFKKCLLDFEALDEKFKQCLLDLGLFPKDQRVSACALFDIWMNMYDHDDMGKDTFTKIFELLYRNLVSSITIGKEANAVVNYCEQIFVMPHNLQTELAIHYCSKKSIPQRKRLIINAQGKDLPASIRRVQRTMSARILSISTGELFSSRWHNMEVPEVEVMVLNIKSETYTLPHFLKETQKLKILNVTNYGLHPTTLKNFQLLSSSTNLTRLRFEHVVIPTLNTSFISMVNLEKFSFIKCKIGNAFDQLSTETINVWPRLVEVEMDNCQDLVKFPDVYCSSVYLKNLIITNCNEMTEFPEEFGKLQNLEKMSLRSCIKVEKLPESITRLQKLKVLDISGCLSLTEFPEQIGNLGGLRMIHMKGCTSIHELPLSIKELSQTQVVCSEELSYKWQEFPNVTIPVVEEDRLLTLTENIISV